MRDVADYVSSKLLLLGRLISESDESEHPEVAPMMVVEDYDDVLNSLCIYGKIIK